MGNIDRELCIRCDLKLTNHKTGVCVDCRSYKCKGCTKAINKPMGVDNLYCSECLNARRMKQRRVGPTLAGEYA